jgi:hypothetical protein
LHVAHLPLCQSRFRQQLWIAFLSYLERFIIQI